MKHLIYIVKARIRIIQHNYFDDHPTLLKIGKIIVLVTFPMFLIMRTLLLFVLGLLLGIMKELGNDDTFSQYDNEMYNAQIELEIGLDIDRQKNS